MAKCVLKTAECHVEEGDKMARFRRRRRRLVRRRRHILGRRGFKRFRRLKRAGRIGYRL